MSIDYNCHNKGPLEEDHWLFSEVTLIEIRMKHHLSEICFYASLEDLSPTHLMVVRDQSGLVTAIVTIAANVSNYSVRQQETKSGPLIWWFGFEPANTVGLNTDGKSRHGIPIVCRSADLQIATHKLRLTSCEASLCLVQLLPLRLSTGTRRRLQEWKAQICLIVSSVCMIWDCTHLQPTRTQI